MKSALFAAACLIALPAAAQAEPLTEARIRAFLDETTAISQPGGSTTDAQARTFLDKHLDRRGMFKSTVMYDIPGYPPQMRDLILNKSDFIKNVIDGRNTMKDYASTVELEKAEINGNEAKIQVSTQESGKAPMENTQKLTSYEGKSVCNQILRDDGGTIIIVSAACETILSFKE